jgi:hypothetical protein
MLIHSVLTVWLCSYSLMTSLTCVVFLIPALRVVRKGTIYLLCSRLVHVVYATVETVSHSQRPHCFPRVDLTLAFVTQLTDSEIQL